MCYFRKLQHDPNANYGWRKIIGVKIQQYYCSKVVGIQDSSQ